MKKKLALLLAFVMLLSLVPALGVSATPAAGSNIPVIANMNDGVFVGNVATVARELGIRRVPILGENNVPTGNYRLYDLNSPILGDDGEPIPNEFAPVSDAAFAANLRNGTEFLRRVRIGANDLARFGTTSMAIGRVTLTNVGRILRDSAVDTNIAAQRARFNTMVGHYFPGVTINPEHVLFFNTNASGSMTAMLIAPGFAGGFNADHRGGAYRGRAAWLITYVDARVDGWFGTNIDVPLQYVTRTAFYPAFNRNDGGHRGDAGRITGNSVEFRIDQMGNNFGLSTQVLARPFRLPGAFSIGLQDPGGLGTTPVLFDQAVTVPHAIRLQETGAAHRGSFNRGAWQIDVRLPAFTGIEWMNPGGVQLTNATAGGGIGPGAGQNRGPVPTITGRTTLTDSYERRILRINFTLPATSHDHGYSGRLDLTGLQLWADPQVAAPGLVSATVILSHNGVPVHEATMNIANYQPGTAQTINVGSYGEIPTLRSGISLRWLGLTATSSTVPSLSGVGSPGAANRGHFRTVDVEISESVAGAMNLFGNNDINFSFSHLPGVQVLGARIMGNTALVRGTEDNRNQRAPHLYAITHNNSATDAWFSGGTFANRETNVAFQPLIGSDFVSIIPSREQARLGPGGAPVIPATIRVRFYLSLQPGFASQQGNAINVAITGRAINNESHIVHVANVEDPLGVATTAVSRSLAVGMSFDMVTMLPLNPVHVTEDVAGRLRLGDLLVVRFENNMLMFGDTMAVTAPAGAIHGPNNLVLSAQPRAVGAPNEVVFRVDRPSTEPNTTITLSGFAIESIMAMPGMRVEVTIEVQNPLRQLITNVPPVGATPRVGEFARTALPRALAAEFLAGGVVQQPDPGPGPGPVAPARPPINVGPGRNVLVLRDRITGIPLPATAPGGNYIANVSISYGGRVYVALRAVEQAIGAFPAQWDPVDNSVTFTDGVHTVQFFIGSPLMTVNGVIHQMMVGGEFVNARAIDGRTMIPVEILNQLPFPVTVVSIAATGDVIIQPH